MDSGIVTDNWGMDWAWGLPLIVLAVVIHAYGLGLINNEVARMLSGAARVRVRNLSTASIFAMGLTALSATILHAIEGFIWAGAYRLVGALQDNKSAMLYSLNAMKSYGHENLKLVAQWQLMGALEALNGWILFGLTTAFLFTVMQRAWPRTRKEFVKPDELQQLEPNQVVQIGSWI